MLYRVDFCSWWVYNYYRKLKKKGVEKMKTKLLKRLHELLILIVNANDEELDKIGVELVDIEKKLMQYNDKKIKNN